MWELIYTRTKYVNVDGSIIVFPCTLEHSTFRNMNPTSAGFIAIGVDKHGNPACDCYGESISLRLKSSPDDTALAMKQITRTPDND